MSDTLAHFINRQNAKKHGVIGRSIEKYFDPRQGFLRVSF